MRDTVTNAGGKKPGRKQTWATLAMAALGAVPAIVLPVSLSAGMVGWSVAGVLWMTWVAGSRAAVASFLRDTCREIDREARTLRIGRRALGFDQIAAIKFSTDLREIRPLQYGRWEPAWVVDVLFKDEAFHNAEDRQECALLGEGHVASYRDLSDPVEGWKVAENLARSVGVGLWDECSGTFRSPEELSMTHRELLYAQPDRVATEEALGPPPGWVLTVDEDAGELIIRYERGNTSQELVVDSHVRVRDYDAMHALSRETSLDLDQIVCLFATQVGGEALIIVGTEDAIRVEMPQELARWLAGRVDLHLARLAGRA